MVVQPKNTMDIYICFNLRMIHVDIGGHPPFQLAQNSFLAILVIYYF
jgi:hypothetical protein